jgi:predicted  nucleic acid-binding Zn-ribbon protein
MNWIEILGLIGGGAGIVALIKAGIDIYNARPNRDKLELDVLNSVIERLDKELARKDAEFLSYKRDVSDRVAEVKKEVIEERRENANFRMAIYQAYRCKFPQTPSDCPVIAAFEAGERCEGCTMKEDKA